MSDIKGNPSIRTKQLQIKLMEMELNTHRMALRKLELDDERTRIEENLQATLKTILDLKKELGE